MSASTLTSKGQTTIPGKIRRHLNLRPGDRLEYVVEADGRVVILPATVDAADLKGMLGPAPRHLSIEEIDEIVRTGAVKRS